jgi:hypothetical protein
VLRLREIESSFQTETSVLKAKVQILEQTLLVNNVTVPDLTSLGAASHQMGNLNLRNGSLTADSSVMGGSPSPSGRDMSDSETTAWSTISGHTYNKGPMVTVDLTSMQTTGPSRGTDSTPDMDIIAPINLHDLEPPAHFPSLAQTPSSSDFDTQEALDFVLG